MAAVPYPLRQKQLQSLIRRLGLSDQLPIQWSLLDLALTHSSVSTEANYEQLEFLGDAVVRLTAAQFLMEAYPTSSVGELSAIRSVLVSDRCLSEIGQEIGLERYLLLGPAAQGSRAGQQARLADALEAVLAALYLSTHTLELIRPWFLPYLKRIAETVQQDPARQNYKAALQEWTQTHYKTLPEYRVQEVGQTYADPERFQAEVWFQGQALGQGRGRSIKAAEQAAAKMALQSIQQLSL